MRDGRDAQALPARGVQVAGLELQMALLALRHGVCLLVRHLEVEADGRVLVEGAHDPLAGVALADLRLRDARALLAERGEAADRPAALELARRQDLDLRVEAQGQIASLVAVKYLAEGVLEDVHAEGVAHDHEASRLVCHDLHLVEADLVEGAGEDVHGEARAHCSRGQGGVVLEGLLCVLGVGRLLLQVQVRTDGLLQLLPNDHAWPHVARAADDEHDAGAALGEGGLHEADGDAERGARAAEGPVVVAARRPGVAREVVQQGVQRELALRHGHKEAPGCLGAHGTPRVVLAKAKLVRHLLRAVLLASAEGVGLGQHRGRQLVDVHHGPEGDKADKRVLRHHREGLLQGVFSLLKLLLDEGDVQHQQEDGRVAHRLRDDVLDGRAHGQELLGQVRLGDVLRVDRREGVPLEAEGAGPALGVEVHVAIGVQDGAAVTRPADHRLVLDELEPLCGLQRGVQAAQGDDDPGRVEPRARPDVP
mmetsp:Transcript_51833/g.160783  ORF Transcript_51833/g.160783 Transcript_51833/m.160783 type:complete len:480 (-) Transcript_51833:104-1543(-)